MMFMKTKIIITHQFNSEDDNKRKEIIKKNIIKMWKRGIFHEESGVISSPEQRG